MQRFEVDDIPSPNSTFASTPRLELDGIRSPNSTFASMQRFEVDGISLALNLELDATLLGPSFDLVALPPSPILKLDAMDALLSGLRLVDTAALYCEE